MLSTYCLSGDYPGMVTMSSMFPLNPCSSLFIFSTALCCACIHFLWGSSIRGGRREGKKKKIIGEGRLLILEAKGNEGFA